MGIRNAKLKRFKTILRIEGGLLAIAGLIHIIFLAFVIDKTTTEASLLWGAMVIGVAYLVFGVTFLAGKHWLVLPALIINALGLTVVLIAWENSPLWMVDPYLIAIDVVSIPILIFLFINRIILNRRNKSK